MDQVRKELIATEVVYLRALETLMKIREKLLAADRCGLSAKEFHELFSCIPSLCVFHTSFLKELHSSDKVWDVFQRYSQYLMMYSAYIYEFEKSRRVVNSAQNNSIFMKFLDSVQNEYNTDIASLLIRPVQRIPRYLLLLECMLKSLDPSDPEREALLGSWRLLASVIEKINRLKLQKDVMAGLLNCNSKKHFKTFEIWRPDRQIIRHSKVTKQSKNSSKSRNLFLFTDMLMWTSATFKYKGSMRLYDVFIFSIGDCSFSLRSYRQKRIFVCESIKDRDIWVREIKAQIRNHVSISKDVRKRKGSKVMDNLFRKGISQVAFQFSAESNLTSSTIPIACINTAYAPSDASHCDGEGGARKGPEQLSDGEEPGPSTNDSDLRKLRLELIADLANIIQPTNPKAFEAQTLKRISTISKRQGGTKDWFQLLVPSKSGSVKLNAFEGSASKSQDSDSITSQNTELSSVNEDSSKSESTMFNYELTEMSKKYNHNAECLDICGCSVALTGLAGENARSTIRCISCASHTSSAKVTDPSARNHSHSRSCVEPDTFFNPARRQSNLIVSTKSPFESQSVRELRSKSVGLIGLMSIPPPPSVNAPAPPVFIKSPQSPPAAPLGDSKSKQPQIQFKNNWSNLTPNSDLKSSHTPNCDLKSSHTPNSDLKSSHTLNGDLKSRHTPNDDLKSTHTPNGDLKSSHTQNSDLKSSHTPNSDLKSSHTPNGDLKLSHTPNSDLKSSQALAVDPLLNSRPSRISFLTKNKPFVEIDRRGKHFFSVESGGERRELVEVTSHKINELDDHKKYSVRLLRLLYEQRSSD